MIYQVDIDTLVFEEDFKHISKGDQRRILKEISKKLPIAPEKFGTPLKGPLKGFRKLVIGQYRVVYKVFKDKILVTVIVVGFRRDLEVYKTAIDRIKRLFD